MPGAREGFISHVRARAVGSAERLARIRPKVGRAAPVALASKSSKTKSQPRLLQQHRAPV